MKDLIGLYGFPFIAHITGLTNYFIGDYENATIYFIVSILLFVLAGGWHTYCTFVKPNRN